jgi:LPXTG-motif cell wall-anchored protein
MTFGYGAAIPYCVAAGGLQTPPLAPASDPALNTNGSPIAGNYCGTSSQIKVTASDSAFSVDKSVQGNLDSDPVSAGGIGKVSPAGGTATYTVVFTNTGKSNLHDPVMYDLLPRVGDTAAISTAPRGSDFAVSLTNVPAPPAGVTISYSTAANPCRPEVLADASNPGCVNDWTTTPPSPLAATTALRIAYAGTVGVSGSPFTQSFAVSYSVSTPATAIGNVAWNTVGTNVHTGDTGNPADTTDFLGAAESSRTGLTASSNSPGIVKSAGTSTYSAVGDTITYAFDVTNTEAVPLTSVSVTDAFTDAPAGATPPTVTCQSLSSPAATCSGATTALQPGQVAHFTATYTVTQADLDHGQLTDAATVIGQPSTGDPISNTSNAVTVTAAPVADLVLAKSATPGTVTAAGQTVSYGFHVTNNGNQTVHGLAIDDSTFSGSSPLGAIACDATVLAPGASTDCHVDYDVTQADMDAVAATITNSATASAVSAVGAAVASNADSATVTVDQSAAMTLDKTASVTTASAVGDPIRFDLLVTNTGNVTLTGLAIDESGFQGAGTLGAVDCPVTTLAPGDATTCTVDYAVVQGDIDNGVITNTATASAVGPGTLTASAGPKSAAVSVVQDAALQLTKTADVPRVTAAGQTIAYTFHIVNAGNVTVTGVAVLEQTFSGAGTAPTVTCPAGAAALAPGDDVDCTASYQVVAGDLRVSAIDNIAIATGLAAGGSVTSDPSTAHVVVDAPPATAPAGLASTGVAGVGGGIAAGVGLLGLGAVLLLRRRRDA